MEKNKEKMKILIAEDDKFLSKVLFDKFTRKNFLAIVASDGIEAINKIKSEKPDIVLLDLIMPNKNGFEILEEVKTDIKYKKIPVIILSNLGQKTDVEKGKKYGVVDYLVKSNTPINDIVRRVEEILIEEKIANS